MADNPSVAAPTSGTYGEGTDLDNLKKALPPGAIGNPSNAAPPGPPPPPPMSTTPPGLPTAPPGRPPGPGGGPPGLPAALLAPTTQPNTPVNTPLQPDQPGMMTGPGATDPFQARMAILDSLTNNPKVAPETRQWAQQVIRLLLGGR